MKKLTLSAVLAAMLCLLLIFSGCANTANCDDEKMQNYSIDDMTMFVGDTASLPLGGADVTLSQNGIVAIENGTIRALAAGTVTVTTRMECVEGSFDITVEDNSIAVTVNNGANGSIAGVESGSYPAGTKLSVTITADAFNYIPTLKVNGKNVDLKIATPVYTADITVTEDTAVEVTYFDYTTRGGSAILAARRDLVAAESTRMATTLFMFDKDLVYESATEVFEHYALSADTVYVGIPYTSGNQSLDAFMTNVAYTDSDGINHMDTSAFFSPRWGFLLGASCADMAYWSQNKVSNTISYAYAQDMTEVTGLYKVGDYTYATTTNEKGHVVLVDTSVDVANNGAQKMYEAYGLLQKGDVATQYFGDANHAIVIADVVVKYNNDGSVNGKTSYILYDDLNGNYTRRYPVSVNGQTIEAPTACRNDYSMYFEQMYNNSYLPMTCKELLTPEDLVDESTVTDTVAAADLDFSTLVSGKLDFNYYISYAVMEITDAEGVTVQKATRFANEHDRRDPTADHTTFNMGYFAERHNFAWSEATSETYALYKEDNMINPTLLASGDYHCTVTVHLGNESVMVVRDFDFTV